MEFARKMIALLLLVLALSSHNEAANILYAIPFTSKSHNIMLRPIGLELARRGHNVTMITGYEEFDTPPNFHQVVADNTTIWEATGTGRPNVFTTVDNTPEEFHHQLLWKGNLAQTEISLKSPEVQKFLQKDNQYDLVISELFFQEATYMLAHKYNAPLILVTTYGNCMKHNMLVRNPLQLASVLPEFIKVEEPSSFWGRLRSLYFTCYDYVWWRYWYLNKQAELAKKYIPNLKEPMPSLIEMQRNASLVLVNSHFTFDGPMALLPNIIEVGGLHFKESTKPLPKDLQKAMDSAKHGVVYMNFGSNVRSSELSKEKKDAFLKVFGQLKQTVLWKWEEDDLPNKPDNVIIKKWMPQKDILSHPNVKVFIAHGGLIGMQEAIYHGVPVLGVPIYGDQYNNLLTAKQQGFGNILDYHDINEQNIAALLHDMLKDRSYKDKAEEISRRFLDRPVSALDTAMFWIEYVIRHKGAEFIKNPAARLSWIEYNMLDVYAFVLAIAAAAVLAIVKVAMGLQKVFTLSKIDSRKKKHH